ncbi:hypothetical protein Y032_0290g1546 [Ancylostoma ceylanicum]|uniref:Uncharacterized protein n=1 Tax=Ancylostoma ceylanicum TaxID=53326 RepID=A0A016S5R8_9BILA|nr:hypothetical protein Y032_0290g1546 [Ancylostoma ceylanicum]
MLIYLLNSSEFRQRLEVEVCKTKREDGIQTLKPLPMSLRHYPLGYPAASLSVKAMYQNSSIICNIVWDKPSYRICPVSKSQLKFVHFPC